MLFHSRRRHRAVRNTIHDFVAQVEPLESRILLAVDSVPGGDIPATTITQDTEWLDDSQPYNLLGNILIRDGATLVRGARDVIEAIQAPRPPVQASPPQVPKPPAAQPSQDDLHGAILERLGPSPIAEDRLIRDIGASAARLSPVLVALEVEGCIQRAPGGLISLAVERVD